MWCTFWAGICWRTSFSICIWWLSIWYSSRLFTSLAILNLELLWLHVDFLMPSRRFSKNKALILIHFILQCKKVYKYSFIFFVIPLMRWISWIFLVGILKMGILWFSMPRELTTRAFKRSHWRMQFFYICVLCSVHQVIVDSNCISFSKKFRSIKSDQYH